MPRVKKEYRIDLSKPADERWRSMIRAERNCAAELIGNCIEDADRYARETPVLGRLGLWLARKITPWIYDRSGGGYADDISAWAKGCGIDRDDLIFANLSYEIAHATESLAICSPFCTSVAFNLPDSVAHCRNMDWPLKGVGPMTRIIHYDGPCGPFKSVGWPGYVGVLSGIAEGRFSATINYAPAKTVRAQWPPSFALRWVFENCENFDAAVEDLVNTEMAAPVLIMLVGTEPNEAVVIEHTGRGASRRYMRTGVLALTNHFVKKENLHLNEPDEILSRSRYKCALDAGRNAGSPRISSMTNILGDDPVLNELTAQQMAFVPKTGKYKVLYHDTDENLWEEEEE